MSSAYRSHPLDPESARVLEAGGLRLALVDTDDAAAFDAWLRADVRGFHGAVADELLPRYRDALGYRRTTGVYDDGARDPATPIATVNSWPGEVTVPGGRIASAWAISSVTVAPTHRRRGIARALLEAELRTAARLGVPFAMLTVSESTLYARYGFGPAVFAADYAIDTRRVRWSGPASAARVQFVDVDHYLEHAPRLYARTRLADVGQMDVWPMRWAEQAGQRGDDPERARRMRALRVDDAHGEARGFAVYEVTGGDDDVTNHTATVHHLIADGVDAYAALWRFLLELPLVTRVRAPLRSVDEPVRWMLGDWRAASVTTTDHLWMRVLDVPAAFASRAATADGSLEIEVEDAHGFAAGSWRVTASGGAFRAEPAARPNPDIPTLSLDASSLGSLILGGVSSVTLADAGRIREGRPGDAARADALLRAPRTPWLGAWF